VTWESASAFCCVIWFSKSASCWPPRPAAIPGWSAAKVACAIAGKKKDYLRDETVGAAS
jgi:hypothetical protein